MGLLVGNYDCTIDAKNRLMIPADLRREVERPGVNTRWYAVLYVHNRLQLMPEEEFEALIATLGRTLLPSDEQMEFVRRLYNRSHRMEPDKQGRIVLPERLLQTAAVGREVTLSGQGRLIEVTNRQTWTAEQGKDDFDDLFRKARDNGSK